MQGANGSSVRGCNVIEGLMGQPVLEGEEVVKRRVEGREEKGQNRNAEKNQFRSGSSE